MEFERSVPSGAPHEVATAPAAGRGRDDASAPTLGADRDPGQQDRGGWNSERDLVVDKPRIAESRPAAGADRWPHDHCGRVVGHIRGGSRLDWCSAGLARRRSSDMSLPAGRDHNPGRRFDRDPHPGTSARRADQGRQQTRADPGVRQTAFQARCRGIPHRCGQGRRWMDAAGSAAGGPVGLARGPRNHRPRNGRESPRCRSGRPVGGPSTRNSSSQASRPSRAFRSRAEGNR